VLIVVSRPLDEPAAIDEIVRRVPGARTASEGPAEVLVLSPAQVGFLDRWASDVEAARREAQERLVITVASLAKAGVAAEARVGDEDLVQAVEDQLQSFAATDVILVTGTAAEDPAGEAAATELEQRLRAEFRRLTLSGRAAR
jgi:predicted TIM-barrel enzyme